MAIKYPLITPGLFRTIILTGLASLNEKANNPTEMAQDKPYELALVLAELKYQVSLRASVTNFQDIELVLISIADSISQQYRNKGYISAIPSLSAEEIKAAAQKGLDEKVPKFTVATGEAAKEEKLLTLEEMLEAMESGKVTAESPPKAPLPTLLPTTGEIPGTTVEAEAEAEAISGIKLELPI